MKISHNLQNPLTLAATIALAVAAILANHTALAGGNGLVKGATLLTQPSSISTPASVPLKTGAMSCAKCKDEAVTRVSTEKGHIQTSSTSQQHMCGACEQKLATTGVGKAAQTELKHSCGNAEIAPASCCMAQSASSK